MDFLFLADRPYARGVGQTEVTVLHVILIILTLLLWDHFHFQVGIVTYVIGKFEGSFFLSADQNP